MNCLMRMPSGDCRLVAVAYSNPVSYSSGVGTAGAPGASAPVKFYRSEVEDHNVHAQQRGSCAV